MQTLWSRVAQSRGTCKCPHCLSYANGVTRRATASATRRAPRYLTSSTFWLSGIFASAATWDAGIKARRREQWDRAIGDLRQELGQPERRRDEAVAQEQLEAVELDLEIDGVEDTIGGYKPFGGTSEDTTTFHKTIEATESAAQHHKPSGGPAEEDTDVFRDVNSERSKPAWPTNTGPAINPFHLPPQSIFAAEEKREAGKVRIWSTKKIKTVQVSMEKFLCRLFHELQVNKWTAEAAEVVPLDFAQLFLQEPENLEKLYRAISERLVIVQRIDRPSVHPRIFSELVARECGPQPHIKHICVFRQDTGGSHRSTTRSLNSSIQHLFEQHSRSKIRTSILLARIAHNISLSPAPPNLETYNTLLLGFSKAHLHTLAKGVIISMQESKIRPNEVSLAATLDHFTKISDSKSFFRNIMNMRGHTGGLMLARPDLTIDDSNKARLIRKEGNPDKIIQLPNPTPYVFHAIIAGVLKFDGFDRALKTVEYYRGEGWGLCMAGLTPLLQDCANRGDWQAGQVIWNKIMMLKQTSRKVLAEGQSTSELIPFGAFAAKLRLCLKARSREVFDEVWDMAVQTHPGPRQMSRLMSSIKSGSAGKAADKADKGADRTSDLSSPVREDAIGNEARTNSIAYRTWEKVLVLEHALTKLAQTDATELERESVPFVAATYVPFNESRTEPATQELQPREHERDLAPSPPAEQVPPSATTVLETRSTPSIASTNPMNEEVQIRTPTYRPALPRDIAQRYAPNRTPRFTATSQSATLLAQDSAPNTPRKASPKKPAPALSEFAFIQLGEEELMGNLPAGSELDEYEMRERPMESSGWGV